MNRIPQSMLTLSGLLAFGMAYAQPASSTPDVPRPPTTAIKPVTHVFHGTSVTDPYEWLEHATDGTVREWTERQNRYARTVLDQYPGLPALRAQIKGIVTATSTAYHDLQYRGGKLFALKFQPPKEHTFLITLDLPDEPRSEHVIVDPNQIDAKGKTTIDFYVPSLDGKLVAVSLSEGGSEEGTVHLYDVAAGKKLAGVIPRVQFPTAGGSLAWNADGSGFYYTHYPRGDERPMEDRSFYQQIYFHKLGTLAEQDIYVLGKEFPRIAEITLVTSDDGRCLLATVQNGDGGEFAHYLLPPNGQWVQLTKFADRITAVTFGSDQDLYLMSLNGAPRGKLLRLPLAAPRLAEAKTIVPESEAAIQGFRLTANALTPHFVVTGARVYLVDSIGGPSQIRMFDHDGHSLGTVPMLPVSSVGEIARGKGEEILFRNSSFLEPPAWCRFDPATGQTSRTALSSNSPVEFHDCEVLREFGVSRDGTRIPMSIVLRKGTRHDGQNPTLLTGYGGFGINEAPRFSPIQRIWLDQGGIYVVANLRGGNEYGEEWHKAGCLTRKQNVFDDFTACARHLIDRKYTNPDKLAIEGGSNGGLLVGAALTQHPELFRVVVCRVGVLDMILHDHHPNGAFNAPEYGTTKNPEQFKAIYAYSPYHHVKDQTAYPAAFFLTGANDGRADPANSRKMAARLQKATSSKRPILLSISSDSGHGVGTALSKTIEQRADMYAFLFQQLEINYKGAEK
jgi:prolyl oligopeptidase